MTTKIIQLIRKMIGCHPIPRDNCSLMIGSEWINGLLLGFCIETNRLFAGETTGGMANIINRLFATQHHSEITVREDARGLAPFVH